MNEDEWKVGRNIREQMRGVPRPLKGTHIGFRRAPRSHMIDELRLGLAESRDGLAGIIREGLRIAAEEDEKKAGP